MKLKGKNIMVTGAAGFIGSHLTEKLAGEDIGKLVALDNMYLGKSSNLDQARLKKPDLVEYLDPEFSTSNFGVMDKIFEKENIDVVFDLATIPLPASLEKPLWCFQEISAMAANLSELCRLGAFSTFIHCSTSEVYGTARYTPMDEDHPWDSRTPYAAAKGAADLCVRSYVTTYGINAVIVRPFNTYGPRQNAGNYAGVIPIFSNQMFENVTPQIFGDGEQSRDFTFVTDTASGFLKIAEADFTPGEIINLAAGQEVSINNLGKLIFGVRGKDFTPTYGPERPGDVRRHSADVKRLTRLTDFQAQTGLDKGIRETIDWYETSRI